MDGILVQAVRDHLERIVADDLFSGAARLCRFLRFTVESKISGREDQIKEFVIGREVFDRKDGYDPRLDPIVRVEARRLRAKLAEYYEGPGRTEPLRLEYPRGSYIPIVTRPNPVVADAQPARRRSLTWLAIPGAIVLAALILAAYRFGPWARPQTVAVLPVQWISDASGLDKTDAGIAEAVDAELANRDIARVIAWPVMLRYQTAHRSSDSIAAELGASTLIMIAVRDADRGKLVSAFLMEPASGRKRRVNSYTVDDVSTLAAQRSVAHQIVGDLRPLLVLR
ncbi:MAG: repeat-containing protein [Candidatus Eremiobacteraeota bacterium]|nr:repeat-containing protein [Candidatus Eremiobacteraeota bacterium]